MNQENRVNFKLGSEITEYIFNALNTVILRVKNLNEMECERVYTCTVHEPIILVLHIKVIETAYRAELMQRAPANVGVQIY